MLGNGFMDLFRELLLLNVGILAASKGVAKYMSFKTIKNVLLKKVFFNSEGQLRNWSSSLVNRNMKNLGFLKLLVGLNSLYYLVFMINQVITADESTRFVDFVHAIFSWYLLWTAFIIILFAFLIYHIALRTEEEIVSEKKLASKYIQFTENAIGKEGTQLTLIGGLLGFLGDVTDVDANDLGKRKAKKCKSNYDNQNCNESKKCKRNCVYRNRQFLQLLELKQKIGELKLLIREPDTNHQARARLGLLYEIFGNKLQVRCYPRGSVKLNARIVDHGDGSPQMFWNWKNNDDIFVLSEPLDNSTSKGATFIYMFKEVLWEQSQPLKVTSEQLKADYQNCLTR